ncbi:MAG: T9SS type A sorting domain-containing protein [Cytophagales bacterium]|nr:T9SS type A sorting domain-containing protein [Bernardetiaceae bacterium]MDW8204646.1 T9SS type A sorting domain-containing protein [Cytophagales bacterium]
MMNLNYRKFLQAAIFLWMGGSLYAQDLSELKAAVGVSGKAGNIINALNARAAVLHHNRPDFLKIDNGRVLINAVATTNTESLRTQLARVGFEETGVEGRMVSGFLPITNVNQLNDMSFLLEARAVFVRQNNNPISQAVQAQAVNIARQRYGLTGKGVKIGILSDSYNNLNGEALGIATGNLPGPGNPNGKTTPVQVLQDLPSGGIDEGRAMAELIHDIVPDAELAFATAFLGDASFAQNIRSLHFRAKCDVIVDDISYFLQPFFQQGIIAQAADAVAGAGTIYLSSAGNFGRDYGYEDVFRRSGTIVTVAGRTYELHDFDPGPAVDIFQILNIPSFGFNDIILQWDEPFASACPRCPGTRNNVDLLVAGGGVSFTAIQLSSIGGDAVDYYYLDNFTTSPINVGLVFGYELIPGTPAPNYVKYVGWSSGIAASTLLTYTVAQTGSGTMLGNNSTMVNGYTIGAAPFFNTPAFGVNPPVLEPFSSRGKIGGTPLFFDSQGKRLAQPLILAKPDMTGVDGVNTSFFGTDVPQDPDAFPNFFGTSASAPNIAAVVAMMIEANGGRMPSHIVRQLLKSTSIDMDDPRTPGFDRGFDFASGSGLVQADAAIDAIPVGNPTNLRGRPGSGSVELTWTPVPGKLVVRYEVYAVASSGNPVETLVGTTTESNFTVNNLINGTTYSFRVRGVTGNGRFTAFTNRVELRPSIILATEVDANSAAKVAFNVYPNPSKGRLNIFYRELHAGNTIRVRLSNAAGQEVLVKELPYQGVIDDTIDTDGLPSGVYILSIETNKSVHRRKVSIMQ